MAPVSPGSVKAWPPARFFARGQPCHGRTVGLDIPGRDASPQSPTPFLQARKGDPKKGTGSSALGHLSHALKIPGGLGDGSPRNLSRWPRLVGMASPAKVTSWKERGLCVTKASDHPQILRTSRI